MQDSCPSAYSNNAAYSASHAVQPLKKLLETRAAACLGR
jgi:hypothetical protein